MVFTNATGNLAEQPGILVAVFRSPGIQGPPGQLPDEIPASVVKFEFEGPTLGGVSDVFGALRLVEDILECFGANPCGSTDNSILRWDNASQMWVEDDINDVLSNAFPGASADSVIGWNEVAGEWRVTDIDDYLDPKVPPLVISTLNDQLGGTNEDDVLLWNEAAGEYQPDSLEEPVGNVLAEAMETAFPNPNQYDQLYWTGAEWVSGSPGEILSLSEPGTTAGDLLVWNGTQWESQELATFMEDNLSTYVCDAIAEAKPGLADGGVLTWNNATDNYEAATPAEMLSDGFPTADPGDLLQFTGTTWNPVDLGTAFTGATPGSTVNDVLTWNGSAWVADQFLDVMNADIQGTNLNDVLRWTGSSWVPDTVCDTLALNKPGTTTNDVLRWNGTTYVPTDIGTLTTGLPATSTSGDLLQYDPFTGWDGESFTTIFAEQLPGTALNDILTWNGATWVPGSAQTVVCDNFLTCMNSQLPGGTVDYIPIWNGATWTVGPATNALPTGTAFNDILYWNGVTWIPGDVEDVLPNGTTADQVLTWNGATWVPDTVDGTIDDGTAVNQVPFWNGATWVPTDICAAITAAGCITGTGTAPAGNPGDVTFLTATMTEAADSLTDYLDTYHTPADTTCDGQITYSAGVGWGIERGIPPVPDVGTIYAPNTAHNTPNLVTSDGDIGMIPRMNPLTGCVEWVDDRNVDGVVLTVPGDFATIQEASNYLMQKVYSSATIQLTANITESPILVGLNGGNTTLDGNGFTITGRTQIIGGVNVFVSNTTFNGAGQVAGLNIDNSPAVYLDGGITGINGNYGLLLRAATVFTRVNTVLTFTNTALAGLELEGASTLRLANASLLDASNNNATGVSVTEASYIGGISGTAVSITINNNGGDGLLVAGGSTADLRTTSALWRIEDNGGNGVNMDSSTLFLDDSNAIAIENNTLNGIVMSMSKASVADGVISDNGLSGVAMSNGSSGVFGTGNSININNNGDTGAILSFNSSGIFINPVITDNGQDGITVGSGSYGRAQNGTFNNNGGWGARVIGNGTMNVLGIAGAGNTLGLVEPAAVGVGPSEGFRGG